MSCASYIAHFIMQSCTEYVTYNIVNVSVLSTVRSLCFAYHTLLFTRVFWYADHPNMLVFKALTSFLYIHMHNWSILPAVHTLLELKD